MLSGVSAIASRMSPQLHHEANQHLRPPFSSFVMGPPSVAVISPDRGCLATVREAAHRTGASRHLNTGAGPLGKPHEAITRSVDFDQLHHRPPS